MVRRVKAWLLAVLLTLSSSGGLRTAQAQGQYDFLFSVLGGLQQTSYSSNDTYIDKLKQKHGTLTSSRVVVPLAFTYEILQRQGSVSVGFGFENHRYFADYEFNDNSTIRVGTKGLFHTLLLSHQGESWEPFLGVGTGTYSANVTETLRATSSGDNATKAKMRISNTHSYMGKVGVRFALLGDCGVSLAYYAISAPITVPTEGEQLELGGDSAITGIYCKF